LLHPVYHLFFSFLVELKKKVMLERKRERERERESKRVREREDKMVFFNCRILTIASVRTAHLTKQALT